MAPPPFSPATSSPRIRCRGRSLVSSSRSGGTRLERRKLRQQNCRLLRIFGDRCVTWPADFHSPSSSLGSTRRVLSRSVIRRNGCSRPGPQLIPPFHVFISRLCTSAPPTHQIPFFHQHQLKVEHQATRGAMQPTSGQGLSGLPPADRINY